MYLTSPMLYGVGVDILLVEVAMRFFHVMLLVNFGHTLCSNFAWNEILLALKKMYQKFYFGP